MKWSLGRLEAVSGDIHGVVRNEVEDIEPTTSILEHFWQSYHTDDGLTISEY